jgi:hypothetical protein
MRRKQPATGDGEHKPVNVCTVLWLLYVSSVCGCIFAVALKGIFGISIAAGSSLITDSAILISTPEDDLVRGFSETALLAVTVFSGLGAFFSGVVLSTSSPRGVSFIKLLFPSAGSWTLRHQLHVTVCIACLAVSHAIVTSEAVADCYRLVQTNPAVLFSVLLLSFSMCAMSSLLTLNEALMLRGGNFTSQVFDLFAGFGFAAKSRDSRYLWKTNMLFWTIAGFVSGCCIGANSYEDTFRINSIVVPIIMLAPLWLAGIIFLVLHRVSGARNMQQPLEQHMLDPECATSGEVDDEDASAAAPGEYESLDTRQYLWVCYVCFVAGCVSLSSRFPSLPLFDLTDRLQLCKRDLASRHLQALIHVLSLNPSLSLSCSSRVTCLQAHHWHCCANGDGFPVSPTPERKRIQHVLSGRVCACSSSLWLRWFCFGVRAHEHSAAVSRRQDFPCEDEFSLAGDLAWKPPAAA